MAPSSRFKDGPRASGLSNTSLEVALWLTTTYLLEEREQLIYSLQSLVADVGGTLGLFLGFSLMWGWDLLVALCTFITLKLQMIQCYVLSAPLVIRMKKK